MNEYVSFSEAAMVSFELHTCRKSSKIQKTNKTVVDSNRASQLIPEILQPPKKITSAVQHNSFYITANTSETCRLI